MSDSDSDFDHQGNWKSSKRRRQVRNDTIITFRPTEEIFDRWSFIPVETMKEAAQRMKVCAFWLPILLQPEESSSIISWAQEIGLITKDSEDLTLRHIVRIEIVEAVLRALENGSRKKEQAKQIIYISNMFNLRTPDVLDDGICWLEQTGEPGIRQRLMQFGHAKTRFTALHFMFTEYARFVHEMGGYLERTLSSLLAAPVEYCVEKSEEMKKKGNENFQKQMYEEAVKYYSKAIKFYPDNHIIYGNRALCYLRSKKYLKAVADGKRAILLKPLWAKGHYRYCEALFLLGEVRKALEANNTAQKLCKDDTEGAKDLEQQHQKFLAELPAAKVGSSKKPQRFKVGLVVDQSHSVKAIKKTVPTKSMPTKVSEGKVEKQSGRNEKMQTDDSKPSKSDFSSKNGKAESNAAAKKKAKSRNVPAEQENHKELDNVGTVCKQLRSLVQDAHTALADLRSRNSEQAFSRALALMETVELKELGLSTMDILLLLFGRASALTEIGQPEELSEARKLLQKIKSYEKRTFQCLVFYAVGRVYIKENRFRVALEQFLDSLQMVKNQITPGKLTWPLTKDIVKETQPDYFKEILENAIELCRFPPPPEAICRLEKCLGPVKCEIYLTDPDFKGFIRICCCHSCTVEYHINCWKTVKTSSFSDRNEKDLLQEPCLTPDCVGQICSIKIYCSTGLVKCKFEATISKPKTQRKQRVNQICTSLKKLKSKEERKLKRKQHKPSFQDKRGNNNEILQEKEDSASHSQQKAWLVYRDRVLLQISQNMELVRGETRLHVSTLCTSLKPWLELDSSRGNQIAARLLNWEQEQLQTLGQVVELMLERKNRVWARVFVQQLSSCADVHHKLLSWACQLNSAGLNAAKSFVERYAEHLEQLDLALLLTFDPLQQMILEKLGTRPELLSSIGLSVTEYLKQAPTDDLRLFIWTLEEHRDDYVSCHAILDEYFDMMDGHCSVLKKSDENQNNSPMKAKSRGRKKKQKEPKGVIVLSGMRGVASQREEWDQDFFEDESLSFLHPEDLFSVPSHLREQVADFEDQYNGTRTRTHYKSILDNNPDPTKESLYDYFAQILEEHGPLVAEDPLLVGELENFPSVAQQKIEEAGGFEAFLLDSLRFIKMGRCIGLAKHAVSLQQYGHGASLDDLDIIVDTANNSLSPDLLATNGAAYAGYLNPYLPAHTAVYPTLPNPYIYDFQSGGSDPFLHWSNGDDQELNYYYPSCYEELDLDTFEEDGGHMESDSTSGGTASVTADENVLTRHAAVQTCPEAMRSVAVNTEIHERFEICQGDINKKEKDNRNLEQQIREMANGCDKVSLKHKEDVRLLEEDLQRINANIQVTNAELELFQQKLEEEVKRDQREKKANQEALKALKLEIEELVEEQGRLVHSIREKKASFEAKLNDFLELGNQSATEKMSLEDEIKRCRGLFSSAIRRSRTAQLSVVESSREQVLFGLHRELTDAKTLLSKLDEASHRHSHKDLEVAKQSWRSTVEELEKKISAAERQSQEQLDQMKTGGRRVGESPPVNNQPEAAAAPAPTRPVQLSAEAKEFTPLSQASLRFPEAPLPHRPATRPAEPSHNTVFDKSMETLSTMFPDYTRPDLMRFVQELRSSSGGSLNNMALQDVVGGVTQLILDHQERLISARSNILGRGSPAPCATPPLLPPAPVWQSVTSQRLKNSNSALNMEDPCIICHEDMSPEDTCVLECRHSFHDECIRSWLKEQSTCPTCRNHALLPEDFPVLPGRRRPAP
ncbi:E3 ubiquitin-protein ligase TTC3 isoform X2 [Mugil cephalus]|uniref:E3 ubiquitin-protein ligase TTC3 isoform X2 n=1 Tax=Mugil cephalus TaxID=48193 RepID=UPI001FB5CC98|nr:E3 ubiquitin-protein ligase TTC3 isoform X2 [Mugil cephalus]